MLVQKNISSPEAASAILASSRPDQPSSVEHQRAEPEKNKRYKAFLQQSSDVPKSHYSDEEDDRSSSYTEE